MLLGLLAGCPGGSTVAARVEGGLAGPRPEKVFLLAPNADPVDATIGSGTYALALDRAFPEARVFVTGPNGVTTTSPKLSIAATTTTIAVEPLALWPARVEIQREGERLRFSWSPFPEPDVRYSLLFSYDAVRDGSRVRLEGSLVVKVPEAVQSCEEVAAILPDRDPSSGTIDIQVRAFRPRPDTPTWAGEVLTWPVPKDLPIVKQR